QFAVAPHVVARRAALVGSEPNVMCIFGSDLEIAQYCGMRETIGVHAANENCFFGAGLQIISCQPSVKIVRQPVSDQLRHVLVPILSYYRAFLTTCGLMYLTSVMWRLIFCTKSKRLCAGSICSVIAIRFTVFIVLESTR